MLRLARDRAHLLEKVGRGIFAFAARLALRVQGGAQEGHGRDTGNFHRVLEREEHALGRALVGRHLEQVFALEQDFAAGDLVARLAGDDMAQRRFAGAVRSHDGVHLALVHGKRKPVEDLAILDPNLQIFDFEQCHYRCSVFPCARGAPQVACREPPRIGRYPTEPSSEIEISFCASTANSIGSCCSTSLTKPLTTRPTASSCDSPRCTQ